MKKILKRILCAALSLALCLSFAACGQEAACEHEFEADVNGITVTLKCKKCGETASADVQLPKETVEVEKEVIKEVEVEKIVEKPVIKEVEKIVEKEVIKEVEVPVYASEEERINAENFATLLYYVNNYSKIDFLKNYLSENYYKDVDMDALMEGAYAGMVDALGDPYSHYSSPSTAEEYENTLAKAYSGIGVTIFADENNNAVIDSTSKGSPAEAAGLLPGDIIAAAGEVNLLGAGIETAASTIRGEIGTTVVLDIIRDGKHITMTVERRQIAQSTVETYQLISNDGYIIISGFNETTASEFKEGLEELAELGCTTFVLDLRNNGGGNVEAALDVADMLMDEAVAIRVSGKNSSFEYTTEDGRTPMKYVVLCNEHSASAAEILCAAIKDNKEGTLVGTTTFGKGVIQVLVSLVDGSCINLTEYEYVSPNGDAIDKIGVTPDYIVENGADCFDENGIQIRDAQLEAAMDLLCE